MINMEAIRMKQNGVSNREIKVFMKDSQKYALGEGCLINITSLLPKSTEEIEDKHLNKQRLKLLKAEKKMIRRRFVGKLINRFKQVITKTTNK